MYANPQLQSLVGLVPDGEDLDGLQQLQRHRRDFRRVARSVASRKTGHDHVGVTDRLHLRSLFLFFAFSESANTKQLKNSRFS